MLRILDILSNSDLDTHCLRVRRTMDPTYPTPKANKRNKMKLCIHIVEPSNFFYQHWRKCYGFRGGNRNKTTSQQLRNNFLNKPCERLVWSLEILLLSASGKMNDHLPRLDESVSIRISLVQGIIWHEWKLGQLLRISAGWSSVRLSDLCCIV